MITFCVEAEDGSVDIWKWPHTSWVQTSMIGEMKPTWYLLTAEPKRSDRNPFCAQMTLKLGPCIIYQSDGVMTFIRKLLQHPLLFSTCVKHFNLHNILITQCHGAACRPHFSFTVSLSSITPTASSMFGTVLIALFIFHLMFTPLNPLYPSPSHKEMWIGVRKVDFHGQTKGKTDVNIWNSHRRNSTEAIWKTTFLWLRLLYKSTVMIPPPNKHPIYQTATEFVIASWCKQIPSLCCFFLGQTRDLIQFLSEGTTVQFLICQR